MGKVDRSVVASKAMPVAGEWKPPDLIAINRARGWGYRFVEKRNVRKKQLEGWVIATEKELLEAETSSMDGAQHYRGLVLMRLPMTEVRKRRDYFVNKHNQRLRSALKGTNIETAAEKFNRSHGYGGDKRGTGVIGKAAISTQVSDNKGTRTSGRESFAHDDPEQNEEQDDKE